MIDKIHIQNFKSIVDLTIPLSNINVFIGENGCGKSNILEAIAFGSAVMKGDLSDVTLNSKGIRVAKPSLFFNSFKDGYGFGENLSIGILSDIAFLNGRFLHGFLGKNQDWEIEDEADSAIADRNIPFLSEDEIQAMVKQKDRVMHKDGSLEEMKEKERQRQHAERFFTDYVIYNLNISVLRGFRTDSLIKPLGIYGEGLDLLISQFNDSEKKLLLEYAKLIDWLEDFLTDERNILRFEGLKSANSNSMLYFKDKYMQDKTFFSAENANEGILFVLFYLSLFISEKTPKFFGIDNIETALNPKLCREIMKSIAKIAIQTGKQAVITTHNPAILDGLNLEDDRQRLFIVKRNDEGHTKIERIKTKPTTESPMKLSEMWMRGYLGGLPTNF